VSLQGVRLDAPGHVVVLSGNEAIARGALEAGLGYAAAYPGSPSSEVLGTLAAVSRERGRTGASGRLYAEWSTNEKVAMEGAAAASFAGVRSMTIAKADGINVALDFMTSIAYSGIRAGMVIVISDDPSAHSSTKEEDTRYLVRAAHLPLLEAGSVHEAKELTRWAFGLSEALGIPVVLRSVTRIAHARGTVTLGPLVSPPCDARYDPDMRFLTVSSNHVVLHGRVERAREQFEHAPFNGYRGPVDAPSLVIAAGPGWTYAREAIERLGVQDEVGLLKLATTWPLPDALVLSHLAHATRVLVLEEIEPFLETEVKSCYAQHVETLQPIRFLGKASGHVAGPSGPCIGELTPEIVIAAVAALVGRDPSSVDTRSPVAATPTPLAGAAPAGPDSVLPDLPARDLAFCAGCPHRASFWAIKTALALDGRDGIVLGDIGCYTLAARQTGYFMLKTVHAMGSGVGLASGFGKLAQFGFQQPVVAVVGDSTFYHAVIPALVNARYNESPVLVVVLDNGTTAMTGHQPHPGTGRSATGEATPPVPIEAVARALGFAVEIGDPRQTSETVDAVWRLLQEDGAKLLVLRSPCALLPSLKPKRTAVVDQERCIGEHCGCNRFCNRVFSCPALVWDSTRARARVDEVLCSGCGVCVDLCPREAIELEHVAL
jgi:indolepyruvate ferredoxin oxidoreductase alpha subunit